MKLRFSILSIICMLLVINLTYGEGSDDPSQVDADPTRSGPVTFTNVSSDAGFDGINGNQFSWGDMDNDGHEDLLIDGKRLFRNSGPPEYHFTEVTDHAGISSKARSGVWGDIDNDGWLDLFCGGGNPSNDHPTNPDYLWHNQRDGTFERILPEDGAPWDTFPTVASGWADMDRDGYLDLYMVNYENGSYAGYSDHFWTNNGDLSFTNMTEESGMSESGHPYQGRGVSWCDYDQDGFMDAYVSNYRIMPNYLYHNLGDGTMEEIAEQSGVQGHPSDHPVTREGPYYGHSLGSSWGDLDNDGDMDLWVTNLAHKDAWRGPICDDSYLFENLGEENGWEFADRRIESGIPVKDIPGSLGGGDELMVSSAMADYDNDGDIDLFIPQIYSNLDYAYSYLYRNDGGLEFTDVSQESGIRVWNTYGSAWCDYNEDGWIDLITGGGNWNDDLGITTDQNVHLYRNEGSGSHWIEVSLEGRSSNSPAIGARVDVSVDSTGDGIFDLICTREIQGGTAAQGQQDSLVLHFGLGERVEDIQVETHWPMGRTVIERNVSIDGRLRLFEPTDPIELSMELISFEPSDMSSLLELSLENPSAYPIDLLDIELILEGGGRSLTDLVRIQGPIGKERKVFEVETVGWSEDDKLELSYSLTRSFPPISGDIEGSVIYDPLQNMPPVAMLTAPSNSLVGEDMEVSGAGSYDPEGSALEYKFDMGDGTVIGWTPVSMVEHTYTGPGEYTIRLSVRDEKDAVSIEDALSLIDISGSSASIPVAVILGISPSDPFFEENVRFEGEGIPSAGSRITDYEWTSSLDGTLSSRDEFSTDELSMGVHDIQFRVKDSSGSWSIPVNRTLEVREVILSPLWVTINEPETPGPYSGFIELTGGTGPLNRVEKVEVRIDSGLWEEIWMAPDWRFRIDCRDLEEGMHWVEARAYGDWEYSVSYAVWEFQVVHQDELEISTDGSKDQQIIDPGTLILSSALIVPAVLIIILMLLIVKGRRRKWDDIDP